MKPTGYLRMKKRMQEAYSVAPNELGNPFLTKAYRNINVHFKRMPFLIVVPATLLMAILLYLISNYIVVRLASILQYGF